MPPASLLEKRIGRPPGSGVTPPEEAMPAEVPNSNDILPVGLLIEAAVRAFAKAVRMERYFAPSIFRQASVSPEASTMKMHCGTPISVALATAALRAASAPVWERAIVSRVKDMGSSDLVHCLRRSLLCFFVVLTKNCVGLVLQESLRGGEMRNIGIGSDFLGRIRNINLSPSPHHALIPLFEAITNSIQAIEERFGTEKITSGRIQVEVFREPDHERRPIGFQVTDNGAGLNDRNFLSFKTADSRLKIKKGGKGVGRFMWLKVFESISIDSVYLDNDDVRRYRRFDFVPQEEFQILNLEEGPTDSTFETKVRMLPFELSYSVHCPKKTDTIKNKIISHFVSSFVNVNAPEIRLLDLEEDINLFDAFAALIVRDARYEFTVDIGGIHYKFVLNAFLVPKDISDDEKGNNALYYGAHGRAVKRYELDNALGLKVIEGGNAYLGFLEGDYFSDNVNQERTDFLIPEAIFDSIHKLAIEKSKNFLASEIEKIREKQVGLVKALRKEYPRFLGIARDADDVAESLQLSIQSEEEIFLELSRSSLRQYKRKKRQFSEAKAKRMPDFDAKAREYTKELEAESLSSLAEYVYRRKLILDVFEDRTAFSDPDKKKYELEEALHELICPLRVREDSVNYNDHNLWIIDDALAFYTYFSSDRTIKAITGGANQSTSEPDLAIFDLGLSFDRSGSTAPITIIEFKRPGRNDYRLDDNPFVQVRNYVSKLRSAKVAKSDEGRVIRHIGDDTPFMCYIVADVESTLQEMMQQFGPYHQKAGHGSYYRWDEAFKIFIEVMSYQEVISNAKARSEAFFERLGIK